MADETLLSGAGETRGDPTRTAVMTGAALFMVSLDNLVVTTALPKIRESLHTGLSGLEWTVNSYTLTFAVLLLTASAVADRFGRRKLFGIGMAIFTLASAAAALAPGIGTLIAARAAQGLGAAIVMPLTLTMLSAAFPPEKRGAALGIWGTIGGLAVALGPVAGGIVIDSVSWQWIFWINVPIGVLLLVLLPGWLAESKGASTRLDITGTVLASAGLFGLVLGLIRGNTAGWTSAEVVLSLIAGAGLLALFLVWESRTPTPMLPLRLFRSVSFSAVNAVAMLMYFGMFGAIFLLTQFIQNVQGVSPLGAGVRLLAWTALTLVGAPIGGILSDKIGGKPIVFVGMALQALGLAWIAVVLSETTTFPDLLPAFLVSGLGMGLYFGPAANLALGSVSRSEEGIASGANNAIREIGGVFGVAVLSAMFSASGGYESKHAMVTGMQPAMWVGAAVVGLGALAALLIRGGNPQPADGPRADLGTDAQSGSQPAAKAAPQPVLARKTSGPVKSADQAAAAL
ncbi:DHA2 family efflux MFS transporter permease subunit [Kitasatospora indigofera]|uniref:DHA2 family efflux MFS transporter permease subunit n=2 Tax=Kitasatospora indigofera TaxID=67307 RepID=UPI00362DDD7D